MSPGPYVRTLDEFHAALDQYKKTMDQLTRGLPRSPGTPDDEVARRRARNKAARKARRHNRKAS
ncbi:MULTISPECIES: hypothetical protein [Rhodococcus]|uniref:hypothetical protein n=1 Tax=Rhodococcus TaxID=1827 RepID=UPI000C7E0E1F|nr:MULTISPECIES: hypothetical protein [Rhodococcus]AUM18250.1 hypothetical protein CSW53_18000 [Rhodococcus ruber]